MEKVVLIDRKSEGKMFVEKLIIDPNETVDINQTENDLFSYILYGYGYMSIENYGYNFEPETSIFIPKEADFSFTNSGDEKLVIVVYGVKE